MFNSNLSNSTAVSNSIAPEVSPIKVSFYNENSLPKNSKLLGNSAKLGSFPLTLKAGKLTNFIVALVSAGKVGLTLNELAVVTYGKVERLSSLSVYFSYDLTRKGIKAAKLPNGNYVIVTRETYSAADLRKIAGIN